MITKRYHWIFDASAVPVQLTTDEKLIKNLLPQLAKLCEMKIIGGPLVVSGVPSNPGISGFCIIDYSHISIHTFSKHQEICVDIFSCKPYDPKKIYVYLCKTFKVDKKHITFMEVKYPSKE
jgi:S-adenosylmethionine decarboxylase